MAKKHYDEVSVVRSLSKKHEIKIDTQNKVVSVMKNSTTVGNGSFGKIDYLCKVHGYTMIITEINNRKSKEENYNENTNKKLAKRESKLGIVSKNKRIMKNLSNLI